MPKGLNTLELRKFFNNKTILPNFRFYVTIIDKSQYGGGDKEMLARTGIMPTLEHYHVVSVTLPGYDFKKEAQKYGPLPRSFAILDYDGLELNITFEEDDKCRVGNFVNHLQKRIVSSNGLYTAPNKMKIDRILVEIENTKGENVAIYTFKNSFFLKADQTEYNQGGNESVKYTVTLNSDYYSVVFPLALAGQVVDSFKDLTNLG